jgi:cytochrome c oxidase cbb3-type subunit 2
MSRRNASALILAATWLLASLVLAACQQEAQAPSDEVLLQDPNYIMGSGLYKRNCSGCHGESGEGRTSLGPQLNTSDWQAGITDDEIRTVILEGRRVAGTSMDSFRKILTDEEITAVITYVRTLHP